MRFFPLSVFVNDFSGGSHLYAPGTNALRFQLTYGLCKFEDAREQRLRFLRYDEFSVASVESVADDLTQHLS